MRSRTLPPAGYGPTIMIGPTWPLAASPQNRNWRLPHSSLLLAHSKNGGITTSPSKNLSSINCRDIGECWACFDTNRGAPVTALFRHRNILPDHFWFSLPSCREQRIVRRQLVIRLT